MNLRPVDFLGVKVTVVLSVRFTNKPCPRQMIFDNAILGAIEHRRSSVESERVRRPTQVGFEQLSEVHSGGYTDRVQQDVDRRTVR